MSTLNEFIASVKTEGMMQTNRFSVDFALPLVLRSSKNPFPGDLEKVLLHCDAVTLPGMSISTQQARTYGEFREMPYERLFENITLSFYIDNTMDAKALFDIWIHSIQDPVTRQFNYYKEYITDMTIYVEDKEDEERYNVKLFECYPKSITSIQMDYSAKEVMKIQVSLNYRYWVAGYMVADENNGPIVNGKEQLVSPGAEPGGGAYDDQEEFPNLAVENERLYPTF
jgi:hypothetical protein